MRVLLSSESVVYSLFCNSLIEGFGSGSGTIPLTNGSGSGRVDPDPDTDRNESTNVPISKLRMETKPKRFDVFQNLKWKVSVYSKNFGTKPKLFDVFQLLFCKRKTFLFFQKLLEQNQNFLMCSNFFLVKAKRYYIIQKILDLKENVLVRQWILFQKRIYSIFLGALVGKRKQTIFKKRWFDITRHRAQINFGDLTPYLTYGADSPVQYFNSRNLGQNLRSTPDQAELFAQYFAVKPSCPRWPASPAQWPASHVSFEPWTKELERHQALNVVFTGHWCLIEFIVWSYSQSCWYFQPVVNCCPSKLSLSSKI